MKIKEFIIINTYKTSSGKYAEYYDKEIGVKATIRDFGFEKGDFVKMYHWNGFTAEKIEVNGEIIFNKGERNV